MKFKNAGEARDAIAKAVEHAQKIAVDAKAEGRKLTESEQLRIKSRIAEVNEAKAQLPELEGTEALRKELSILSGPGGPDMSGDGHPEGFGFAASGNYRGSGLKVAGRFATSAIGASVGRKAAVASGSTIVPTPIIAELRRDGERPVLVSEIFPVATISGDQFRYLRQTVRTNNAAAVPRGGTKPTSVFTIESIDDRARVVAHISEPLNRVDIDDSAVFGAFIDSEMRYGVAEALDDLVVNGDGTGETFEGLLAVSGINAQAFDTDMLTTIRKGITTLALLNIVPTHLLLHPGDVESLELTRSDQHYVLSDPGTAGASLPIDRSRKTIWATPYVASTAVPQGTGILVDAEDVVLVVREETRVDVSENVSDDWAKNLVRLRAEMRACLAPLRPAGICELDLVAGS
jgi:HK97 family phage major capsid protein